jgi:hypothetical protein
MSTGAIDERDSRPFVPSEGIAQARCKLETACASADDNDVMLMGQVLRVQF